MKRAILLIMMAFYSQGALADQEAPIAISHCYHWLQSNLGYLKFKLEHARDNDNELTFFSNPQTLNQAWAGRGLYCAQAPSGSFSYGDRVIRVEFVQDVVILDEYTGTKYCGRGGGSFTTDSQCQQRDWDVKFYDKNMRWYLIKSPQVIKRWTINSPQLIKEVESDILGAISDYRAHANNAIRAMRHELSSFGELTFINGRSR
ncbi:MAG: hypothetical protein AAGB31_12225 [Bdellovibrio sp.]